MRLIPLRFDLAEAVNQAITGMVTILGVILGGRIAFKYGLKHLRAERAFDKGLDLLEGLDDEVQKYLAVVRQVIRLKDSAGESLELPGLMSKFETISNNLRRLALRTRRHADDDTLLLVGELLRNRRLLQDSLTAQQSETAEQILEWLETDSRKLANLIRQRLGLSGFHPQTDVGVSRTRAE